MKGNNYAALKAYTDVQTKVAIDSADQHTLVSMLFNGIIDSLILMEKTYETRDLKARSKNLTKSRIDNYLQ